MAGWRKTVTYSRTVFRASRYRRPESMRETVTKAFPTINAGVTLRSLTESATVMVGRPCARIAAVFDAIQESSCYIVGGVNRLSGSAIGSRYAS